MAIVVTGAAGFIRLEPGRFPARGAGRDVVAIDRRDQYRPSRA